MVLAVEVVAGGIATAVVEDYTVVEVQDEKDCADIRSLLDEEDGMSQRQGEEEQCSSFCSES